MKPVVFNNREEVAALVTRLIKFNMLDDWVSRNPTVWVTSALFYSLESVSGIVVLDGIIPNREANCHIFLFEKPGIKCKNMVTEIRKEIKKYFRMFGLKRLIGHIPTHNLPSRRLAVTLGFKMEGITRKSTVVHGQYGDLCVYSIIDSDFEEVKDNGSKLAEHLRDDRKRNADDGPAVEGKGSAGLHIAVEKDAAKEDDRGATVDKPTSKVRFAWILRLFRYAFGIANPDDAAIRPQRASIADQHKPV